MESGTVEPPSPVLIMVVVVGNHTNDGFVVGAGVGELTVPVIDKISQTQAMLAGTNAGDQRSETTIFAAVVVMRQEATDVVVATNTPLHATIPVVDVTMPGLASVCNPARQHRVVLVGTLKFA